MSEVVMKFFKAIKQTRGRILLFIISGIVLSALVLSSALASSQTADSRPRRSSQTAAPQPASTPTPAPAQTGTPAATVQTSPARQSSTPTPQGTATDRIAPTLGDPPPPPKLKPTPTPEPPADIDEGSRIVVNAELVQLHVRVIDRNNRPIDNVGKNEFHVFEDGVPQPIESFTREEVPISYGLAIDTSGSLRSQLPTVIDAGKTIINSNKTGDETFLVKFVSSDNIETIQDFTSNKELLTDGLDSLYIEGGQTAITDAVYLSAEHVSEYKKGDESDRRRRALVLITDGEDRSSFYRQEQLFARLREDDVQIFVIGFVNELDKEGNLIRKSPRDKAVAFIQKLASETGGRAFFPDSVAELPQISNEIIRDLRTQYVLAYNPTNKTPDGSYRAIKVSVDERGGGEKRIALTRNGRLARREGQTAPKPPPVRLPAKPGASPTKRP
jgi:Ca-activated chloride channel family protein